MNKGILNGTSIETSAGTNIITAERGWNEHVKKHRRIG